jgi:hypothetical protein
MEIEQRKKMGENENRKGGHILYCLLSSEGGATPTTAATCACMLANSVPTLCGSGVVGRDATGVLTWLLLCARRMCQRALTMCPAASALSSDSSPAMAAAAM